MSTKLCHGDLDSSMNCESAQPRRVLHVIGAMDRGGAETFLMNVYRNIDRTAIQFDFLVHETRECDFDREICSLGGNIYRISRFNGLNFFSYISNCRRFFSRHHDYAAVHVHIGSCAPMVIAEAHRYGLYAIAHSHNTNPPLSADSLAFQLVSFPTRYMADYFLACSYQAGLDRFGSRVAESSNFAVMNNGIDVTRYRFSSDVRTLTRDSLGVDEDTYLICHIGRFDPQKNHHYLIEIFDCWLKERPNSVLLLIGRGNLRENVERQVDDLGIKNRVCFLGIRSDVPELLMASDLFIFPSTYEGLGIAAVEAQATGLPCLISESLPEVTHFLPTTLALPIDVDPKRWVEMGNSLISGFSTQARHDCWLRIKEKGFDIRDTADRLCKLYLANRSPS